MLLNLLGPPVSSNFWCTFSGDSLDWDIGLTFSQRLAILHPHQNSRFTQQKHAIYAFAKSKSLEQKIYLLILSLHYLITLKMFIITTQSTQEKYEQQTNYKCRLVLDMGFSSLPHSPHRRWLILSHSYLRALKLSALSIKVTFNMWIFGLSHILLELSFQRYKKNFKKIFKNLNFSAVLW